MNLPVSPITLGGLVMASVMSTWQHRPKKAQWFRLKTLLAD